MMSLWDALRMNMMISYQELVRTFQCVYGNVSGVRIPPSPPYLKKSSYASTGFFFRLLHSPR
ncbi:hypothetical protein DMP75_26690 [Klebsiella michiganensis]|nr:hypothetical protein DMP75_26690 [Klebsiella michiganensis]